MRGHVTTADMRPVVGAEVTITRAPDRAVFRTLTDRLGEYRVMIDSGTGDYLVHVRVPEQPSWPSVRRRVKRTRSDESVLVSDFIIQPAQAQTLAPVRISSGTPTVRREEAVLGAVGVGDRDVAAEGMAVQLSPDSRGDPDAIARTLPGVTSVKGGYSVLGVSPNENSVALNGVSVGATRIPRDAPIVVSLTTSAADPAIGWFTGARANVNIAPGMAFTTRSASVALDHPIAQPGSSGALGYPARVRRSDVGLGGSGLMLRDHLAYSYGMQISGDARTTPTLESAPNDVFARAGIAQDSIARLRAVLADKRLIPLASRAFVVPSRSGSFVARLNTNQYDPVTFAAAPQSSGIIVFASHDDAETAGDGGFATATTASRSRSDALGAILTISKLSSGQSLQDWRLSVSARDDDMSPTYVGASGQVLVTSAMAANAAGVATVRFGGTATTTSQKARTLELESQRLFFWPGRPQHRLKLNATARIDQMQRSYAGADQGSYGFGSIADLAGNRPLYYSRTLGAQVAEAAAWNGFVSFGDIVRVTPTLQAQMGLRVEGNRFVSLPNANGAVRSTFGVRNDFAPSHLHVSPRFGFTWAYKRDGYPGGYVVNNGWGVFAPPATGVVRAGIGEYRAMIGPLLLLDPSGFTGLGGGLSTVECIGADAPLPPWAGAASEPTDLAGRCDSPAGSAPETLSSVRLIEDRYDAPSSWRAHLSWTGRVGRVTTAIEGALSLNTNQQSQIDLNLDDRPRFLLSGEQRPVFVPYGAISVDGGTVALRDSRKSPDFGRVLTTGSHLSSTAMVVTTSLRTMKGKWALSGSYTWQNVRGKTNGFVATTAGHPSVVENGRSDYDIRHSVLFQLGRSLKYINLSMAGRLSSGRPYTPLANGDLNGDGLGNDRAFIFDPSETKDSLLAKGMTSLLHSAPNRIRTCLARQLGRIAAQNSCEGPWTAELTARIGLNTFRMNERWHNWVVELFFTNPLAGIDEVLHGRNPRGWGSPTAPNRTLLQVVGFDPVKREFVYRPNAKFGDTRANSAISQSPFRVTLSVKIDLARSLGQQQLERFLGQGRNGRPGKKLSAQELQRRYARNVIDPYRMLQQYSDSLLLSPAQLSRIDELGAQYRVIVDSAWLELGRYLENLPDNFSVSVVMARQEKAIDDAWELGRRHVQRYLPSILSALQKDMVPDVLKVYLTATQPMRGMRTFVYGDP